MTKILDPQKAQTILDGIKRAVAKLTVATIENVAAAQADKLHDMQCKLAISTDATKADPKIKAEVTYGGRKYKELL
jgi:hypothetical protein